MSTILKKFKRSKNANSIWRQPLAVVGILIIAIWTFLAIFAPWIAPYNPNAQDADKFLTPSAAHWMGTDELGRDIWSRIIHGARISLPYSLLLVVLSATLGSIIGAISGYAGGKVDSFIMRVTDVFFAFPGIVLAMAVAAAATRPAAAAGSDDAALRLRSARDSRDRGREDDPAHARPAVRQVPGARHHRRAGPHDRRHHLP